MSPAGEIDPPMPHAGRFGAATVPFGSVSRTHGVASIPNAPPVAVTVPSSTNTKTCCPLESGTHITSSAAEKADVFALRFDAPRQSVMVLGPAPPGQVGPT